MRRKFYRQTPFTDTKGKQMAYVRGERGVSPAGITGAIGGTLVIRWIVNLDTDSIAQRMTYAKIEAGDVNPSVLDFTSTRFRHCTTAGGRSGRRRGGGGSGSRGSRSSSSRQTLPVVYAGVCQQQMGSRVEVDPQSLMTVQVFPETQAPSPVQPYKTQVSSFQSGSTRRMGNGQFHHLQ